MAFKITLGLTDAEPVRWDGSIDAVGARLLSLTGWRFLKDDGVLPDAKSWKCSTRRAVMLDPQLWWWPQAKHEPPADPNARQPIGPMLTNGVFLALDRAGEIRVSTANGQFSFSAGSIPFGKPAAFLNGRVIVERAVAPWQVTSSDGFEDDNASVAIDAAGRAWTAWIGYAKGAGVRRPARPQADAAFGLRFERRILPAWLAVLGGVVATFWGGAVCGQRGQGSAQGHGKEPGDHPPRATSATASQSGYRPLLPLPCMTAMMSAKSARTNVSVCVSLRARS